MLDGTMKKQLGKSGIDVDHTAVAGHPQGHPGRLTQGLSSAREAVVARPAVVPFKVFLGDPAFAKHREGHPGGHDVRGLTSGRRASARGAAAIRRARARRPTRLDARSGRPARSWSRPAPSTRATSPRCSSASSRSAPTSARASRSRTARTPARPRSSTTPWASCGSPTAWTGDGNRARAASASPRRGRATWRSFAELARCSWTPSRPRRCAARTDRRGQRPRRSPRDTRTDEEQR